MRIFKIGLFETISEAVSGNYHIFEFKIESSLDSWLVPFHRCYSMQYIHINSVHFISSSSVYSPS